MKALSTDYLFVPASRQITVNDYTGMTLEQLLLITNVTDNKIIYSFADPNLGATLSGSTLTLQFDTAAMSATDNLQIFFDVEDPGIDMFHFMNRMLKAMESLTVVDSKQRQRVLVDGVTGNGLGCVIYGMDSGAGYGGANWPDSIGRAAVAPSATYWQPVWPGPVDQRYVIMDATRLAYDQAIRSHLTWS